MKNHKPSNSWSIYFKWHICLSKSSLFVKCLFHTVLKSHRSISCKKDLPNRAFIKKQERGYSRRCTYISKRFREWGLEASLTPYLSISTRKLNNKIIEGTHKIKKKIEISREPLILTRAWFSWWKLRETIHIHPKPSDYVKEVAKGRAARGFGPTRPWWEPLYRVWSSWFHILLQCIFLIHLYSLSLSCLGVQNGKQK